MKYLAAVLLFAGVAFAHDEECVISSSTEAACGACRCKLEERPAAWIRFHDFYWACFDGFHQQQVEYGRCLGAVREREMTLTKRQRKHYIPFVENPNVLTYVFKQHPVEDAGGNSEVAQQQAEACQVQLGRDIIPEVLRCSAHLASLRKRK